MLNSPVVSVYWIDTTPEQARKLVAKTTEIIRRREQVWTGFLGFNALANETGTRVLITSEWADVHSWSQSRYDPEIGSVMEDIAGVSSEQFELFVRPQA